MHELSRYEELLDYSEEHQISVDEKVHFKGKLSGLFFYDDETDTNNIALSDCLTTSAEKSCILAEELGHYNTSSGIMMDLNDEDSRKQERRARMWAYNYMVGIHRLLEAYLAGCSSRYDIAEYLDVTEPFLQELIDNYRTVYGIGTYVDGYFIRFIPNLSVIKMMDEHKKVSVTLSTPLPLNL